MLALVQIPYIERNDGCICKEEKVKADLKEEEEEDLEEEEGL